LKLKNKGVLLAGLFVVAAAFIAAGCGGDSGGGAPEALPSSSCTVTYFDGAFLTKNCTVSLTTFSRTGGTSLSGCLASNP